MVNEYFSTYYNSTIKILSVSRKGKGCKPTANFVRQ